MLNVLDRFTVLTTRELFFNDLLDAWARPPEHIDRVMGQAVFYIPPDKVPEEAGSVDAPAASDNQGRAQPQTQPGAVMHAGALRNPIALGGVTINDPDNGILLQSFTRPKDWGEGVSFAYSVLLAGDWLRFGVLLRGTPAQIDAFSKNRQNILDADEVWDRPSTEMHRGQDSLLLEWRFAEPDFYTNFAVRDRFVQIARHLHFRLGETLR